MDGRMTIKDVATRVDKVEQNLDKVNRAIYGTNGRVGMLSDLASVKGKVNTILNILYGILMTGVALLITSLWKLITN